jgi:hypothetical protein
MTKRLAAALLGVLAMLGAYSVLQASPAGATLIHDQPMNNGTGQRVQCHDWGYWYTQGVVPIYHIICYRFSSAGVNLGEMLNVGVPHECYNTAMWLDGSGRPNLHLYHADHPMEVPVAGENGKRGCGTGYANHGTQGMRVVSVKPFGCGSNCYNDTAYYTGQMWKTASTYFWTTCGSVGVPCYYGHGYSAVFLFT